MTTYTDDEMEAARMDGEGPSCPERVLPLAPPKRPMLLADEHIRISFIPDKEGGEIIALSANFEGEDRIAVESKLLAGRIEIVLVDGFNKQRTLQLSPAELMLVTTYADRFFDGLIA